MKIIAGSAKGFPLQVPKGEVRPTQDRVREALFNILTPILPGARLLDLFCGTGSVGLEALSRGAAHACMVDASREACSAAQRNYKRSKLSGALIVQSDCLSFTARARERYDVIFADPPYCKAPGDRDMIAELLTGRVKELLEPGGYFIAEAQRGYGVGSLHTRDFPGWSIVDERHYGKNVLLFYQPES